MKECLYCGDEASDSCHANSEVEYADGVTLAARPHEEDGRCPGCGVAAGGLHHVGCEEEPCPRCGRLLLFCGCLCAGESR